MMMRLAKATAIQTPQPMSRLSASARASRRPQQPVLRFTPTAWAKLLYMRDLGSTEVGGFGVTAAHDLLRIEEVHFVKQLCTPVSVVFDDAAVAEFFDAQVDRGLKPEQFARIWVHTHPGSSAEPSSVDEETFGRVFGPANWAVMFILAQGGQTYSRLRFNVGPGGSMPADLLVDFGCPFPASAESAWAREHRANIRILSAQRVGRTNPGDDQQQLIETANGPTDDDWFDAWSHYLADEPPLDNFDLLAEEHLDRDS